MQFLEHVGEIILDLVIPNGWIQEGTSVLRKFNESLDPNGLKI